MVLSLECRLQLLLVSWVVLFSHAFSTTPTPTTKSSATSFIELVEPETNCTVILLGCLHGSRSSASDVQSLIDESVDAVVLELCASRFNDLKRQQPSIAQKRKPAFSHFVDMVIRTGQKKGWTTGVAAAVLGGASGLQTALSGFEPGLEFTTALERASLHKSNVVLADQTVDETLRKVGTLPSVSLKMLTTSFPWNESRALQDAVMGDALFEPYQVNMGKVLTRSDAVRRDLIKLTLPPLLLAQFVAFFVQTVLNHFMDPMETAAATAAATQIDYWSIITDMSMTPMDLWNGVGMNVVVDMASSILVLGLGYVAVALPATRIILCERDDQLTNGIRAACRASPNGGRVVAVLGLLHVNGVAKRLLSTPSSSDREAS
jgi:hypothetical protein